MCDIEILKVAGNGPGLDALTVIGNVQRCEGDPLLIVQLTCPIDSVALLGRALPFQGTVHDASSVFIGSNGDFFATFEEPGDCRCGGQMLVSAQCAQEPDCQAELLVEDLECVLCPRDLEEGTDDVVRVSPECESGATALVTLSMRFDDMGQPTVSFRFEPGHPDGEVVSESVSINPDGTRTVTAQIRFPTLSFPEPYVVAVDSAGELLGCPPWPIEVGQMPPCCPDAEITAEVDGCMVVVNADPISVPHGCQYVWNFDTANTDDIQLEAGDKSQRVHHYDRGGTYVISVKVTCGTCNGEEAQVEVEVEDCQESPRCQLARYLGAIAAALSLFAAAMITCLPELWPALVAAAAVFAVASGVIFYFYRDKCKSRPCRQALLSSAQALLIAGFALVLYSGCCQTVLASGLAMVGTGLGLLYLWRSRCNKTWCQYAAIAVGVVGGVLAIIGIVQSVPVVGDWFDQEWFGEVTSCLSTTALGAVSLALGIPTIGGLVCSARDDEDSTFI